MSSIAKFQCPNCGEYTNGAVTKTVVADNIVRRVRECDSCNARFVTAENIVRLVKMRNPK